MDMASSDEYIYVSLCCDRIPTGSHLSAQFINVQDHQSKDQTWDQVCHWAEYFYCFEKWLYNVVVVVYLRDFQTKHVVNRPF